MVKVAKRFDERREELRQALYRIDGAINRYKESCEIAEIGIIAVELRSLLGKQGQPGLILKLAAEKNFPLEFSTFPPELLEVAAGGYGGPRAALAFIGDCVSLVCEKPWTYKTTMEEWLETQQARPEETWFYSDSRNDLPLLEQSFDEWSAETLAAAARDWRNFIAGIDREAPPDPRDVAQAAALYTRYLQRGQTEAGLSRVQPGRFTMPARSPGMVKLSLIHI